MTNDIVAFLRERLDEDERIAAGCQQRVWELDGARIVPEGNPGWSDIVDWVYDEDGTTREHIARHDPARVLRDVEAKRQLLEVAIEMAGADRVGIMDPPWIFRVLALSYSDHPDYRQEWA